MLLMLPKAILNMCDVRISEKLPPAVVGEEMGKEVVHTTPGTSIQNSRPSRPGGRREDVHTRLNVRNVSFSLSFSAGPFDSIQKLLLKVQVPFLQQLHFREFILLQWFSICVPYGTLGFQRYVLLVLLNFDLNDRGAEVDFLKNPKYCNHHLQHLIDFLKMKCTSEFLKYIWLTKCPEPVCLYELQSKFHLKKGLTSKNKQYKIIVSRK